MLEVAAVVRGVDGVDVAGGMTQPAVLAVEVVRPAGEDGPPHAVRASAGRRRDGAVLEVVVRAELVVVDERIGEQVAQRAPGPGELPPGQPDGVEAEVRRPG